MSEVTGWVHADNVTRLCQYLAAYTHIKWDDADQDALDGMIGSTDAEADEWFEYPIGGTPELLVALANDVGSDVVNVRVRGDLDRVLAARIDTLIDVL
jgi:hypothetical protein